ncbi:hypothetical protein EAF00_002037 [Botryotinia globosa]|nr:hypothetical protein EAF00_002037 [Botryotinia globosa]
MSAFKHVDEVSALVNSDKSPANLAKSPTTRETIVYMGKLKLVQRSTHKYCGGIVNDGLVEFLCVQKLQGGEGRDSHQHRGCRKVFGHIAELLRLRTSTAVQEIYPQ